MTSLGKNGLNIRTEYGISVKIAKVVSSNSFYVVIVDVFCKF